VKRIQQRMLGTKEDGNPGDCFKCCIASVLEREYEEVPHFVQIEGQTGYYHLDLANGWLRKQGYHLELWMHQFLRGDDQLLIGADGKWISVGDLSGFVLPGYWLATVESKRLPGEWHVVVMYRDHMVWDPSDAVGTPEYDAEPFKWTGWADQFIAPRPDQVARTT